MTAELQTLHEPLSTDEAERLNADILAWHETGDTAQLAHGYHTGGQDAALRGDVDAACFLFTQAYVFALRAGLPVLADSLWSQLKAFGREA